MRKMLVLSGLIALASFTVTGCTSFSGISQTDKTGSYYVTTNKPRLFGILGVIPEIMHCTSDAKPTKVTCQPVEIEYKW